MGLIDDLEDIERARKRGVPLEGRMRRQIGLTLLAMGVFLALLGTYLSSWHTYDFDVVGIGRAQVRVGLWEIEACPDRGECEEIPQRSFERELGQLSRSSDAAMTSWLEARWQVGVAIFLASAAAATLLFCMAMAQAFKIVRGFALATFALGLIALGLTVRSVFAGAVDFLSFGVAVYAALGGLVFLIAGAASVGLIPRPSKAAAAATMLLLCFAPSQARADELGPLAPEIREAANRGQPLVVELNAAWCGPCKVFDAAVMPDRQVRVALSRVHFVRLDIDTPRGAAVAEHYKARGVPTFLIVGRSGAAEVVHTGVGGRGNGSAATAAVTWFVDFLASASTAANRTAALQEAVARAPDDDALRLSLAEHYLAQQRRALAATELHLVLGGKASRELKARAADRLDAIVAADRRVAAEVEAAQRYALDYSDSPLASERIAFLAVSNQLDDDALHALARVHARHTPVSEPGAMRAAILAGVYADVAPELRERIAAAPNDAAARLTLAEMLLHEDADGLAIIREVCARPAADLQLRCLQLESGLALRAKEPGVEALRRRASARLADLDAPGKAPRASLEQLGDTRNPFGNAVAAIMRDAGKACADTAEDADFVAVEVAVEDGGGRPRRVDVLFPDEGRLASCMRDRIADFVLPAAPPELGGTVMAMVPVVGLRRTDEPTARETASGGPYGSSRAIAHGALFHARARAGAVSGIGLAVDGLSGRTRLADLRLMLGYEGEVGLNANRGATYGGGRALVGAGIAFGRSQGSLAMLVGAGATAFGEAAPLAFEVPFEIRGRFAIGRQRLHLWTRASYLFGDRARTGGSVLLEGDEVAAGAGLTLNLDGARIFVGAAYEDRAAGSSTLLQFGLPVGGYF